LNAGHNATALYQVQLRPRAPGKIAAVFPRWTDPNSSQVKEIAGDVNTRDLAQSFGQTSPRFQMNATVAQFAEILRKSPYAEPSLHQLSEYAWRVARLLPNDAGVQEFAQLVQRASTLR
jgi:hypothetical protein